MPRNKSIIPPKRLKIKFEISSPKKAAKPSPMRVTKRISDNSIPNETITPDINPLFRLVSEIAKNTGPNEMVKGKADIIPRKKNFINLRQSITQSWIIHSFLYTLTQSTSILCGQIESSTPIFPPQFPPTAILRIRWKGLS